jgi:hypothetical protein
VDDTLPLSGEGAMLHALRRFGKQFVIAVAPLLHAAQPRNFF